MFTIWGIVIDKLCLKLKVERVVPFFSCLKTKVAGYPEKVVVHKVTVNRVDLAGDRIHVKLNFKLIRKLDLVFLVVVHDILPCEHIQVTVTTTTPVFGDVTF